MDHKGWDLNQRETYKGVFYEWTFFFVMARGCGKMGTGRDEMLLVKRRLGHLNSTPNFCVQIKLTGRSKYVM